MATETVSCGSDNLEPHSCRNCAVFAMTFVSTWSGRSWSREGVSLISSDVKSHGLSSGVCRCECDMGIGGCAVTSSGDCDMMNEMHGLGVDGRMRENGGRREGGMNGGRCDGKKVKG